MKHLLSKTAPGTLSRIMIFLVATLTLIAYAGILKAPFLFDDLPNIVQNPDIRLTELSVKKIAAAAGWPSLQRAVAYSSFAINYYIAGYQPFGYHLVNIIIHIFSALIVYFIAIETLRLAGIERRMIPEMTVLVWLVHPLHIQSVTYIVQRMNALAAMFFLMSLYLYIMARRLQIKSKGGQAKVRLLFLGCAGAGGLAILSKEIAVTLPVIIFLYEWYFFQNLDGIWVKQKIRPLGITVSLFFIIVLLVWGHPLLNKIINGYDAQPFTLLQRLLTEPGVIVYYISLLVFPHPSRLNVDHDFPLSVSLLEPTDTILALTALIMLLMAVFYRPKRHRLLSFAILWFLVTLMVESSFIGLAIIFEHRTYLPSVFPVLLAITFLIRYTRRPVAAILLCLIVITGINWTIQRNTVWRDTLSFWEDCARKSPRKARPVNGLGVAFQTNHQPEEALKWFQRAVQLDPGYDEAYNNIGSILINLDRVDEAATYLKRATELNPDSYEALSNLGSAMHRLNQGDMAIDLLRKAISICPQYEIAHNNLAAILTEKGDIEGALRHLNLAARINPDYPEVYNNLGLAMTKLGRTQDAIMYYEHALALNPEYDTVHFNLGTIWFQKNDLERARHHLEQAARLDPTSVLTLNNLATVLVLQKKYEKAVEVLSRLAVLRPASPTVKYNLACVFALDNKQQEAVSHLKQAIELGYDRWEHILSDPDLENIRLTDFYQHLMQPDKVGKTRQ